ncbi:hypothetical protein D3C73_1299750 [compost metagenome]
MSTVIRNKVHTARKFHECDGCGGSIGPGIKYRRLFGSAHSFESLRELKLCSGCSDLTSADNDGHSDIMYMG